MVFGELLEDGFGFDGAGAAVFDEDEEGGFALGGVGEQPVLRRIVELVEGRGHQALVDEAHAVSRYALG